MDRTQYSQMPFGRRSSHLRLARIHIPARPAAIVIGLIVFAALWWLVPANVLFWVLLPVVGVLLWMATYSWRRTLQVIRALVDWLERLEE